MEERGISVTKSEIPKLLGGGRWAWGLLRGETSLKYMRVNLFGIFDHIFLQAVSQ